MRQYHFQIGFTTPAFLGNADQSGQWRTPPFKAQLRQWWRVAYAGSENFPNDFTAMRVAEGKLFGHAWLEGDRSESGEKISASRSKVRIRLNKWTEGTLNKSKWSPLERVQHPEVKTPVPADLYLGYGPVVLPRGERSPTLKANAAIQATDHGTFSLACPEDDSPMIESALGLMDRFGTAGGRSRNGWGSYGLFPVDPTPALPRTLPLRPWRDALALDWPHAVGSDARGALIWQTQPFSDWRGLMKELAVLKIGLRTQFEFPTAQPDGQIHERHWLSYPVTRHSVKAWGGYARLPNSLRFKVRPTAEAKVVGVIFHMPCRPPNAFSPNPQAIADVWEKVHAFLDAQAQTLTRISA